MHRRNGLHLILALPQGGTSAIPAAWTDLGGSLTAGANEERRSRTLGSLAHLLHTRRVVDALLRRLDSSHPCPAAEEGSNATGASGPNPAVAGNTAGLGARESEAASEAHRASRASDQEGCACRAEEAHR